MNTPQILSGLLITIKQRAIEKESSPEAKFDVFSKAVANIPKPLSEAEARRKAYEEAAEFMRWFRQYGLNVRKK